MPIVRVPVVRVQIVLVRIVRMPVVLGANRPGVNCPGANHPGANCPGGNRPGANCPGANCPHTVYINRKKFRKHETKGIFVNENLTPKHYDLFKQLLGLKKQKVVDNAWSNEGRLFVWRNGSKTLLNSQATSDGLILPPNGLMDFSL
jgi:hypothetical protein